MATRPIFDHLAGIYQQFRPEYPLALLEQVRDRALRGRADDESALVVDVGAGTGISTRLLRRAFGDGPRIVGMEPSTRMRAEAVEHTPGALGIEYCDGLAERLPFGTASVCLVVAAQAAHWFDRPCFYRECLRVLEPAGVVALLYNNRAWEGDRLLEAYESYLEANNPGHSRGYRAFPFEKELAAAGFDVPAPVRLAWRRPMTREEFIGMCLSSTKTDAVVQLKGREAVTADLHELLSRHHGIRPRVEVPYVSEAILGVKPA
jgi:SAM-dependent methyltransferase